jgi:hypothetical protein
MNKVCNWLIGNNIKCILAPPTSGLPGVRQIAICFNDLLFVCHISLFVCCLLCLLQHSSDRQIRKCDRQIDKYRGKMLFVCHNQTITKSVAVRQIVTTCKMRPPCKIPAQLLNLAKCYGLPKLTTYTVVKSQFLGLQLSRQILFVRI